MVICVVCLPCSVCADSDITLEAGELIAGIIEGGEYKYGELKFSAAAYRSGAEPGEDGSVTFLPLSWRIADRGGTWDVEPPYEASLKISQPGDYTLSVTYGEYIFGNDSWSFDGNTQEVTVDFCVTDTSSNKGIVFYVIGGILIGITVYAELKRSRKNH